MSLTHCIGYINIGYRLISCFKYNCYKYFHFGALISADMYMMDNKEKNLVLSKDGREKTI